MKNLSNYTEEELLKELENRKKKALIEKPIQVPNPDFSPLIKMIENEIKKTIDNEYFDDDFECCVYEKVIDIIYGDSFWDWLTNNKYN